MPGQEKSRTQDLVLRVSSSLVNFLWASGLLHMYMLLALGHIM